MNKKKVFLSMLMAILVFPMITSASIQVDHIDIDECSSMVETPDWATGNFAGIVGITSNFGNPGPYGGIIAGYYEKEGFKGKFAGVLAKKDASEASGFIGGYLAGPFLLGLVTNSTTEKIIPIVGIGLSNETHMYYRIMGIIGPTMYVAGRYQSL